MSYKHYFAVLFTATEPITTDTYTSYSSNQDVYITLLRQNNKYANKTDGQKIGAHFVFLYYRLYDRFNYTINMAGSSFREERRKAHRQTSV